MSIRALTNGLKAATTRLVRAVHATSPGPKPEMLGAVVYENPRAEELEKECPHSGKHGTCWSSVAEQVETLGHLEVSGKPFYVTADLEEASCYVKSSDSMGDRGIAVVLEVATRQLPAMNQTFRTVFFPNESSPHSEHITPPIYVIRVRRLSEKYIEWRKKQSFGGIYDRMRTVASETRRAYVEASYSSADGEKH